MNRYIDANKYEQELRRMIEIVHETGHAPGISGELVIPLRVSYLAGAEAAIKSLAIYREHEEAKKPKTNADRIRQMTDDELAEMVSMKVCRIVKPDGKDCPKGFYFGKCDKCVLAWLKQEVKTDDER